MERRTASVTHSMSQTRTSRVDPYRDDDEIPSSLYDTSTSRFSDASLFRRGPGGEFRTNFPWRTTLVTVLLLGTGLTLLLLGLLHFRDKDKEIFIAFTTVGGLCLLPGGYLAFNLIQTYRGIRGYDVSQFAHWDDYRW